MNHIDLFAGIGGFSLAARWMGWNTIAQVEWDEYCQKVLQKNFPNVKRYGDIRQFGKKEADEAIAHAKCKRTGRQCKNQPLSKNGGNEIFSNRIQPATEINVSRNNNSNESTTDRIDIITGGFPCQPFSHAGKREGTTDDRYLWPEMLRVIREIKPRWVIGENVAGIISMEDGRTLDRILSDLEAEGYQVETYIIPACGVEAWHRRDRVWIVAHSGHAKPQGWDKSEKVIQRGGESRVKSASCISQPGQTADVPDTESAGLERWIESGGLQFTQRRLGEDSSDDAGRGRTKPRLGGMVDALSTWMDYFRREPEGIPRVATGIKNRTHRLKGLGNAIVPTVVYEIFKAIESAK